MAKNNKARAAANTAQTAAVGVNEKVLQECHKLYTDSENGLLLIAKDLNLTLLAPRKKIIVLLVGNHSAGKSSFINWYIEEHVQKTGVAIETQGLTLVTSGRKRETLTGEATLQVFPHFHGLKRISGLVNYLTTEVSTSKQKKFSLVTFVDTPGLVDGDMKYGFDVNAAIEWLGEMADLVFVFFDPIGQALCKRTLNLVEALNEKRGDRIRFYLSKADEAGHESDRQRVMMQIVQELCKRPGLNKTGFDMPTIYIPNPNKPSRCANQIEDSCKEVEKTINLTVQNTLNQLEKDCDVILSAIGSRLKQDNLNAGFNRSLTWRTLLFVFIGSLVPFVVATARLLSTGYRTTATSLMGEGVVESLETVLAPLSLILDMIPAQYWAYVWFILVLFFFVMLLVNKVTSSRRPTLKRKERKQLEEHREFVEEYIKPQKVKLYQEYLRQSVMEGDL